jgi:hypothetical protein
MDISMDALFTQNIIMITVLCLISIGMIIMLWVFNNRPNSINIIDIFATEGKLNERKVTRFGAWIVSTWGFVYLISDQKLTEWYFIGYMTAWVANALIGKALNNDNDTKPTAPTTPE